MRITVNGKLVEVSPGTSVAAAVCAAGEPTRHSLTGAPRGPLCAMGICFECRVTINGIPHQRSCQLPVAPGMVVDSALPLEPQSGRSSGNATLTSEVAIIGAGPAGRRVALVDDNLAPGGQIWRALPLAVADRVSLHCQTRVVAQLAPHRLRAETPHGILDIEYQKLILATGARERYLPFPGWTLPHVLGAGGLQALVKAGLPIAGKRVVVAGTGPLLVAVAAYLRQHGAKIVALCEQAGPQALLEMLLALPPSKWLQALQLARALRGVKIWGNCWPVEAKPGSVTVQRGESQRSLDCDYLACGFHLIPNVELARLLGCQTQNGFVVVNDRQQTTVPEVYCAGEPTGIGGLERAQIEGRLAGLCATGAAPPPRLLAARARYLRFADHLAAATALRPELRSLARPGTLVCRCEDVPFGALGAFTDARDAKLHTRCGMGPCQARICGPACEELFGWPAPALRPPIFPATLATLAAE